MNSYGLHPLDGGESGPGETHILERRDPGSFCPAQRDCAQTSSQAVSSGQFSSSVVVAFCNVAVHPQLVKSEPALLRDTQR